MEKYSSEALKKGIAPEKSVDEMTAKEIRAFQDSLDPDLMGFDGQEGMVTEDA